MKSKMNYKEFLNKWKEMKKHKTAQLTVSTTKRKQKKPYQAGGSNEH